MNGREPVIFHRRGVGFVILCCTLLFTLGCSLFSPSYWIHRLDDEEPDQEAATQPVEAAEPASGSVFGSKCLNSPGDAPCPVEACVVYKGDYTAKYEVASELFGKANPSDYQCCADYKFINSSGVDLMAYEHNDTEFDDSWTLRLYPADTPEQSYHCESSFSRKNGKETFRKGITEVVVLYANPHCDWIQWDEPELRKYRVPVEAGCYAN